MITINTENQKKIIIFAPEDYKNSNFYKGERADLVCFPIEYMRDPATQLAVDCVIGIADQYFGSVLFYNDINDLMLIDGKLF